MFQVIVKVYKTSNLIYTRTLITRFSIKGVFASYILFLSVCVLN